ncbi:hypothetical protein B0I35DRAFT_348051 [Stachybotrys elegans]|uniref:Amine oxidase n=1 Tax=Stachybotrys elegans TaxID=80388 RepID=A0A8K0SWY3_9HYPO|nr:hypothetical protein B0I35DRAFT_348051 [Stachybotrys elegans]
MSPVKTVDLSNTAKAYFAPATVSPAGRLIHVSGQVGSTKDGHVPADYESQIHLALLNLHKVIITAGSSVSNIAKLTLFIVNYNPADRKHTPIIEKFLRGHRPAITLVPVQQLAVAGWLFEIEAVVALPDPQPLPAPVAAGTPTESFDVVVVGAGLAGLAAAESLLKMNLSTVVLEARDRVGGKTWSQPLSSGGGIVEIGAAWLNDVNQPEVYALAKRLGVELIEQNTEGKVVAQTSDGSFKQFNYGDLPQFDADTVADIARIRDMCEADCQALSAWQPRDKSLDSMTFEAYLRSRGASPTSIATATVWTRAMLGQEPRDLSALFFLNYCVSGGGLLQMRSDRKGGGQHLRIRQGTQSLSKGLASSLPSNTVRLSSPVVSIVRQQGSDLVQVTTKDKVFMARKVILTVPSPVLKSISFSPKLSPAKQLWSQSTSYGYYTKAMMVFKSPFWAQKGFCGLTQSFTGPASVIRDTSSPADNKHVLTCFMSSAPGRAWAALSTPEREKKLLEQIGDFFGVQSTIASEFVEMIAYEWVNDEYAGFGCPCASLPPGVIETLGPDALREPCGDLYFAGTETAGEWKGYMEGAFRSGLRAAKEVLRDLESGPSARL